jgi:hypothetical protein
VCDQLRRHILIWSGQNQTASKFAKVLEDIVSSMKALVASTYARLDEYEIQLLARLDQAFEILNEIEAPAPASAPSQV